MTAARKQKKLKRDILRIVLVVAFFAAVAYVLQLPAVRSELLDIEKLRRDLQGYGVASYLYFFLAASVLTGVGVPRLWVSAAAGGLYGAVLGVVLAQFASTVGATVNFYIGRFALRGPIRRRLPARLRVWYDRFGENGFRWLLYLRLFPLSNATVTNLVCGASEMRVRDFLAATLLGYLPFTVAFALFGSSAAKGKPWQMLLGTVLFAAVFGLRWWYKRSRVSPESDEENELPPPAPEAASR